MNFEDFSLQFFRLMLVYLVLINDDPESWDESEFKIPIPELSDHWEKSWTIFKAVINNFHEKQKRQILEYKELMSTLGVFICSNDFNIEAYSDNLEENYLINTVGFRKVYEASYRSLSQKSGEEEEAYEKFRLRYRLIHEHGRRIKNILMNISEENQYMPEEPDVLSEFLYSPLNFVSPAINYNALAYGYLDWMYEKNQKKNSFFKEKRNQR